MNNAKKRTIVALFAVMILTTGLVPAAEKAEIKPAQLEKQMPDFELPTYDGKTFRLSDLKGKNVMLVFPRGYAAKDHWCNLCNYQYADMVEYDKAKKLRDKYNLEIVYILPYDKETVSDWFSQFPSQLEKIENWKNPKDTSKLNDGQKKWSAFLKKEYPKTFVYTSDNLPAPYPILIDEKRELSRGLDLFRTEWSGQKVEQNIPAIYLIDSNGTVKFKYLGQNTFDRPSMEYIEEIIKTFLK